MFFLCSLLLLAMCNVFFLSDLILWYTPLVNFLDNDSDKEERAGC